MKSRKEEFLDYNRKTFADIQSVLPKFTNEEGDNKKWWLKQSGYGTNTFAKSAKELTLKVKGHLNENKKLEEMIISDQTGELAP